VDGVLPSVVRAVLDVSKGHVKIEAALATAAVEMASNPAAQAAAAGLLTRCLACLLAPRPAAAPTTQAAPKTA
jgi:hypothetical protein